MKKVLLLLVLLGVSILAFYAGSNSKNEIINAVDNESDLKAVDLGLSVSWANKNLGAEHVTDFGGYYPITNDSAWDNEVLFDEEMVCRINPSWVDSVGIVNLDYDIAHINLGGDWRLPTCEEMEELIYQCKWSWGRIKTRDCVYAEGVYVEGPNGNKLFLPAAGTEESQYGDTPFGTYRCSYFWDGGAAYIVTFTKPEHVNKLIPEKSPFGQKIPEHVYFESLAADLHFSVRAVKPK